METTDAGAAEQGGQGGDRPPMLMLEGHCPPKDDRDQRWSWSKMIVIKDDRDSIREYFSVIICVR